MTTCAKALQAWAAKEETPLEEAKIVKIYAQIPPINKMDNSLNQLVACEQLSMSTNAIDRILPLPGLKALKILSLGRNNLKKVDAALAQDHGNTLEQLWVSYNKIGSLDGINQLQALEVLYMSNNNITSVDELAKLAGLPKLRDVLFIGNPFANGFDKAEYRVEVIKRIPQISKLDGEMITPVERESAGVA
jgi:dynein light chain 1, axonemal